MTDAENQLYLPRKDFTVDEDQHAANARALEVWAAGPHDSITLVDQDDGGGLPPAGDYPEGTVINFGGVQYMQVGGSWVAVSAGGDGLVPPTPVGAPIITRAVATNILNMSSYTAPADHLFYLPEFAESTDGGATWTGFSAAFGQTDAIVIHGGLDYAKLYKYRFRTMDSEGLLSGYSPESDPVAPRQANEDGVDDIAVGTISADMLEAIVVLTGLLTTGIAGQRVEISKSGIRLYDGTGSIVVNIPVTGDASFTGGLIARSLDLVGSMTLRATTPDHEMAAGAKLHMGGSLAVTDPATPPTLDWTWDTASMDTGLANQRKNLWYDAAGTGGPTWWICRNAIGGLVTESLASTGVRQRSVAVAASTRRPHGAVRVAAIVYVLVSNADETRWYIQRRDNAGLALLTEAEITGSIANVQVGGLGYNGTHLLIPERDTGIVRVNKFTAANPPVFSGGLLTSTPVPRPTLSGPYDTLKGIVELAGKSYVGVESKQVIVCTTAGIDSPADYFEAGATDVAGIGHDGTQFWTGERQLAQIAKHTNWTSATPYVQAVYTWYNPTGTKETLMSPGGVETFRQRAKLRVSFPAIPGGATQARVYGDETASSTPSAVRTDYKLDAAYGASPSTMVAQPAGANPPAANNFGTGTAAEIYGSNGLKMKGDGTFAVQQLAGAPAGAAGQMYFNTTTNRLYFHNGTTWVPVTGSIGFRAVRTTAKSHLSDTFFELVDFTSTSSADGGYDDDGSGGTTFTTATDRFQVPTGLDGLWLVMGRVEFSGNSTGNRRELELVKNATYDGSNRLTGGTVLDGDVRQNNNAAKVGLEVLTIVSLAAGDNLSLAAFQSSGGNLAYDVTQDAYHFEAFYMGGLAGALGGGGSTPFTLTTVEKSLVAAPNARRSGHFQITGLTGLTVNKPVLVQLAGGPYTGKGTRTDEAEMDAISCVGKVLSATTIDVYWEAQHRVRGNYKFDYAIGA